MPGPNYLWHIDTNHKLIRWHFVIAGGVDGYSRLIMFLHCADNNNADTLLSFFKKGVGEFVLPLRVRTDKGMENVKIADFMLQKRGLDSVITGESVHNQRIERLWRDVYDGVLSFYRELFYFMEDEGILDILNEIHIFAIHHVYMSKINEKLNVWRHAWASHRLRTVRSSPLRLWSSGHMNNPVTEVRDAEPNEIPDDGDNTTGTDTRPIFDKIQLPISEHCKQRLEFQCPHNWNCSNFGINIYCRAVDIIEHDINNT